MLPKLHIQSTIFQTQPLIKIDRLKDYFQEQKMSLVLFKWKDLSLIKRLKASFFEANWVNQSTDWKKKPQNNFQFNSLQF